MYLGACLTTIPSRCLYAVRDVKSGVRPAETSYLACLVMRPVYSLLKKSFKVGNVSLYCLREESLTLDLQ